MDVELPLETLCMLHESRKKDIALRARILKDSLAKLALQLEVIRKETPTYSVYEANI